MGVGEMALTPKHIPNIQTHLKTFMHSCVMKVAASRDDEEYSLSMELATKEIEFALAEKVGHQLYEEAIYKKCVHHILDFR